MTVTKNNLDFKHRSGNEEMEEHNIDRKNNRKVSILIVLRRPGQMSHVIGNTLYAKLEWHDTAIQNWQVRFGTLIQGPKT